MDRSLSGGSLSSLAISGGASGGGGLDESPRTLSRSLRTTKRRLLLEHVHGDGNATNSVSSPNLNSSSSHNTAETPPTRSSASSTRANPEGVIEDSLRDMSRSLRTMKRQLLLQQVDSSDIHGNNSMSSSSTTAAAGGGYHGGNIVPRRHHNQNQATHVDDDFVRSILQQKLFAS